MDVNVVGMLTTLHLVMAILIMEECSLPSFNDNAQRLHLLDNFELFTKLEEYFIKLQRGEGKAKKNKKIMSSAGYQTHCSRFAIRCSKRLSLATERKTNPLRKSCLA